MNNVIVWIRGNIDFFKIQYYNISNERDIGRLPPSFLEDGSISLFYFFVNDIFNSVILYSTEGVYYSG